MNFIKFTATFTLLTRQCDTVIDCELDEGRLIEDLPGLTATIIVVISSFHSCSSTASSGLLNHWSANVLIPRPEDVTDKKCGEQ